MAKPYRNGCASLNV